MCIDSLVFFLDCTYKQYHIIFVFLCLTSLSMKGLEWGVWVGCLLPNRPAPSLAPLFQAVLREIQDAMAKAGQVVRESVGGLQTVRSFGAEEQEVRRYKETLEQCRRLWWRRDLERALYLLLRRVRKLRAGGRTQVGLILGVLVAPDAFASAIFFMCLFSAGR